MKPLIEFQDVSLGYGKKTVLSQITFVIYKNDFMGIVGPNGSGKSTLLKSLLGIHTPKSGAIKYHINLRGEQSPFGYVPQRSQLDEIYPFTLLDVVMMGRYHKIGPFRKPSSLDMIRTRQALEHLGLEDLRNVPFASLSGGQKQRALIARALASEAPILILDEPTEGLDLSAQSSIMDLLQHFHQEHHFTIIMVSHELDLVANHVHRLALLQNGDFQIGRTPEIITAQNLSQVYQTSVSVFNREGKTFIATGARDV